MFEKPDKVNMLKYMAGLKKWNFYLKTVDPLEEGEATHSSILAWRIPWTEETVGLQSVGSRVGLN